MKPKYSSLCSKSGKDLRSCGCPDHHQTENGPEPETEAADDAVPGVSLMILPEGDSEGECWEPGYTTEEEYREMKKVERELAGYSVGLMLIFTVVVMLFVTWKVSFQRSGPFADIRHEEDQGVGQKDGYGTWLQPPDFAKCSDECTFTLVESIPQNLSYGPSWQMHTSTYAGLKTLLASAQTSVRIASFYWTLRGSDLPFHDDSSKEGEDIFNSLLMLSKGGKVSVQIAQNAVNNDTDILATQGKAEVRTLNFTRLLNAGVLHTKFWLVDDRHFYVGSANLDWRSLTQVKELGVLVQDCPCLAGDLLKVFQVYWYLGQPHAQIPPSWPPAFSTNINATSPALVPFNGTHAPVYMSSSPPEFCPKGRTGDSDAILKVIREAKHFVYIAVMDYSPSTLYQNPNVYWPVIDDALRHAAFDRGVTVRMLASRWKHTHKDMSAFLCSMQMLSHIHYPRVKMQVKLFEVPTYTKNQSEIPYARVNHNKYMVTDQDAYIGTSNWSGDYFLDTAGVGFVVRQPEGSMNTTKGNFRRQLYDVFIRDWYSDFASNLSCNFNLTASFMSQPELHHP